MFTAKLTKGQAQDLSLVLGQVPPKDIPSLKEMSMLQKIVEKMRGACEDVATGLTELDASLKPLREKLAKTPEAEKDAVIDEINAAGKDQLEALNTLREGTVDVELSEEQSEYLRKSFSKLVMPNFKNIKSVLSIAEGLGIDPEKAE